MIKKLLPYPVLNASLVVMWLLLTHFSLGQLILAIAVSIIATQGLAALAPQKPQIKNWLLIPKLIIIVLYDIGMSNFAVARAIIRGKKAKRQAGFVPIPLDLTAPVGLAILSVIVTSTPGTAWIEYNKNRRELLLHVFDLRDEDDWVAIIKNRYEKLLREIFE